MKMARMAPVIPKLIIVLIFLLMVSAVSVSTLMDIPLEASSSFSWAISLRTRSDRSITFTSGDLAIIQVITSLPLTRE